MAKKRKRNKKWLSWLIILILLVGAVVVCVLVKKAYFEDKPEPKEGDNVPAVAQEIEKEEEKKEEEEEKKEETVEKEKTEQYDGQDPNTTDSLTGVVTYAGVNGDNLMIRVNIDQYLSSGSCKLTLSRDGNSIYNSEAGIVDSAATSTCEGFNVPVSELGKGNVQIVIYINSGNKTGQISGEAEI